MIDFLDLNCKYAVRLACETREGFLPPCISQFLEKLRELVGENKHSYGQNNQTLEFNSKECSVENASIYTAYLRLFWSDFPTLRIDSSKAMEEIFNT